MAISFLQQGAFMRSPEFTNQVNGVVAQQALYKYDFTPNLTPNGVNQLAQVARSPSAYGFVNTMVADAGWSLTYDAWAQDPAEAEGAIMAGVQKAWPLLVGVIEVQEPPPEPEPVP